jgi:hypothetical protein
MRALAERSSLLLDRRAEVEQAMAVAGRGSMRRAWPSGRPRCGPQRLLVGRGWASRSRRR